MRISNRKARMMDSIPRWAIVRTLQQQSVAEHSYHVAMLSMEIMDWMESKNIDHMEALAIVYHALTHDLAEVFTGDQPSTVRRDMSQSDKEKENKLTASEFGVNVPPMKVVHHIVKLADCLEAWQFLMVETKLGNTGIDEIIIDVKSNLRKAYRAFQSDDQWASFQNRFMADFVT